MTPARRMRLIRCLVRMHNLIGKLTPENAKLFEEICNAMTNEELLATWQSIELITDEAMGTDVA